MKNMQTQVVAVHRSRGHHFSKDEANTIRLIEGHGVEGDAHCGITVKHRSRVAKDPFAPNLRQVHLMHGSPRAQPQPSHRPSTDELDASGTSL